MLAVYRIFVCSSVDVRNELSLNGSLIKNYSPPLTCVRIILIEDDADGSISTSQCHKSLQTATQSALLQEPAKNV